MNGKKKYLKLFSLFFIILFCYVIQTIVYSAFSSSMKITGSAHSRIEADVRITDFRLASTNNATSSYEEFGKSHIITEVNLNNSSSSITYYLEITNYGSADVGIFDITGLPSGVNYSIKDYNLHDKICDDTGKCNSFAVKTYEITLSTTSSYNGSIQLNFDFRTYHKVIYTDIENKGYPVDVIDGGNLNITFKEDLKRVQVFSNGIELGYYKQISNNQTLTFLNIMNDIEVNLKPYVAKLVSGNINDEGSEVCIGNECFYIISNDGETVSTLAKYNLEVGKTCHSESSCSSISNPSGIQNNTMIGYPSNGGYPRYGVTIFSSSAYWENSVSELPAYVYSNKSSLYSYVENYKTYLENQEIEVNARLIKMEELETLGCRSSSNSCQNAPKWVYATSYWTGTAEEGNDIWTVKTSKEWDDNSYKESLSSGLRPVIEIALDEIEIPPPITIVSGDYDTVGSEVCIKDECFYVISSTNDTVTMFAKYNLYVGGTYNTSWKAYGTEATGLQDSTMLGWKSSGKPYKGSTKFSDTIYWADIIEEYPAYVYDSNSTLYNYIENYKTYLENLGAEIEEARLIKMEELELLGCDNSDYSCTSAPSWVYRSSYWTGEASNNSNLWLVDSGGNFGYNAFSNNSDNGVRPVITIIRPS